MRGTGDGWTSVQVGCATGAACPAHTWWRVRHWPADYDRCRAFATVDGAASFGCVRAYDHVTYRVNVTIQQTHKVCRCSRVDDERIDMNVLLCSNVYTVYMDDIRSNLPDLLPLDNVERRQWTPVVTVNTDDFGRLIPC